MNNFAFQLNILRQHWVKDDGKDDPDDLCSHGAVYLKIGNEVLADAATGSWTLCNTALYLMRSLRENHALSDYVNRLLPCCGHFFIADEQVDDFVILTGCPTGIDWTIQHLENGQVLHRAESGEEGVVQHAAYKKLVLDFADAVEEFYKQSHPKNIPADEFQRQGYAAFWKERRKLRAINRASL